MTSADQREALDAELAIAAAEYEVRRHARGLLRRILGGVAVIAGLFVAALLLARAIVAGLSRLQLDPHQFEALRTVVTVALQVVGVLLLVFVVVGPSTQLATIIGLATAGLTVALEDFIIAFFGWFVLTGRRPPACSRRGL